MKHTTKALSPTQIELTVTLDDKDLAKVRPITVAKLSQNLRVQGFRPGKVPANVAEKNLDQTVLESQVVEDAVNRHVIDILTDEEIRALDRPQVDVTSFVPKQSLEFKATVEVLPEVKLGDYKKLDAKKDKVAVKDSDIDDVVERMRNGFAEKESVDRAAKDGDEAVLDFEGKDKDGKTVQGAKGSDYPLILGSKTFIPGFEEGIVGKKPGESFDLPLTFPKDYHAEELKGAKVTFTVTLKELKEVKLPEVNDEFAKKCGPFENIGQLREDIKRELKAQKDQAATDKLKDALLQQLVEASEVPVPESLVQDQMNHIERDTIQNLLYRGQTLEQYLEAQGLSRDEWRDKELKGAAERRVQVGLILAELSKAENIEVSQAELEQKQAEQLQQYTDPKIKAQLDTAEARRDLANRVLTEKTVNRLVELNTR